LLRIDAGVPEGPSLAQRVPADVKLDFNGMQALRIGLERPRRLGLLAVAQLVSVFDQALAPHSDSLVVHR